MIRVKLDLLCSLNNEIQRIEKEKTKYQTKHQQDLAWCNKEKAKLVSEGLLEKLNLSPLILEIAKSHYYKGLTWELASAQVCAIYEDKEEADKWFSIELRSREKKITREISRAIEKSANSPAMNQNYNEERIVHVTQQTTKEELKITKEAIDEEFITEFAKKQKERGIQILHIGKRTTQKGQK